MSNKYGYIQFEEIEQAIAWVNMRGLKIVSLYSTPKGVYVVYETNNNND